MKSKRRLRPWVKWCLSGTLMVGCIAFAAIEFDTKPQGIAMTPQVTIEVTQTESDLTNSEQQPYSLDEYQQINPYIVAIVEFENSDGTHRIPVIETFSSKDGDYWSSHAYDGSPSTLGSAFIDEHTPWNEGNHLLINGHSSYNDQRMFTFMLHYQQADYFNANPTFKWIDDLGVTTYTVYAFAHYPMDTSIQTTGMFLQNDISSIDLVDYLDIDRPYILHQRDADTSASRYLSFVTCDQDDKTNRYILLAYSNKQK